MRRVARGGAEDLRVLNPEPASVPLTRTVTVFAPVEVSIVAGEIETPVSVGAVASQVAPNAACAIHSAVINAIPHVRPRRG